MTIEQLRQAVSELRWLTDTAEREIEGALGGSLTQHAAEALRRAIATAYERGLSAGAQGLQASALRV